MFILTLSVDFLMIKRIHVAVLPIGSLLITACVVRGAQPVAMAARVEAVPVANSSHRAHGRIQIGEVDGGSETRFYSGPNVSNRALRDALALSLERYGLLAQDSARVPICLTATLVRIDSPQFGGVASVESVVRYRAERSGATVFATEIRARSEKTIADAKLGVTRRRLANEASIQANIEASLVQFRTALDTIPDLLR